MSYLGGKAKETWIARILNHSLFLSLDYYEPFCGYCHILKRVTGKRSYHASDAHPQLVRLLTGVQRHEALPEHITRERYHELRCSDDVSLESAVACFAYSFNGKAWAGYAPCYVRRSGRLDDQVKSRFKHYASLQASEAFKASTLTCCDYGTLHPTNGIVYCDIPYKGTQGFKGTVFDHDAFWATARMWTDQNIAVLVSEYDAPEGWRCIAQAEKRCTLAGVKHSVRVEKLFAHETALARLKPLLDDLAHGARGGSLQELMM